MEKYLNHIEKSGLILLIAGFVISTLWGSDHAFFPTLFAVVLLVIAEGYKALHWKEYESENKRNAYIALFIVAFLIMDTLFGM